MTFSLKQNFTVNNFWYRVRRTQTSPDMFSHVSKYLDISLLPKTVDFLFRSCNVVAFLLEKWLRRKKCRASVCSPVPTNVRRILTRRKLPTRGSTYVRTYERRRRQWRAYSMAQTRLLPGSQWRFFREFYYSKIMKFLRTVTGYWVRHFLHFLSITYFSQSMTWDCLQIYMICTTISPKKYSHRKHIQFI